MTTHTKDVSAPATRRPDESRLPQRYPTSGKPHRRTPLLLVALLIILALVLVACGDDDNGDGATTSSTEDTTTSETSEPTTSSQTTTTSPTTSEEPTTQTTGGDNEILVFFSTGDGSDCSEVTGFARTVAPDPELLLVALTALTGGPTAEEEAQGAFSFFSEATAQTISNVTIDGDVVVVDFVGLDQLIPNAGTSCGSAALLAQLNATVFQFPEYDRARYLIDGSCENFGGFVQIGECVEFDRNGQTHPVSIIDQASGSGCSPGTTDGLPDGRWYGIVTDTGDREVTFDLSCWFTGAAAAAAAAEDGEESPPPNDYYTRNDSNQLRTLPVADDADVHWLGDPSDVTLLLDTDFDSWAEDRMTRPYLPAVWLNVVDGEVVTITEQYVP